MQQPQMNVPYRRSAIQAMCGGEMQTFLPQEDGIIIAGCFTVEKMNPCAPLEILAGNAPAVAARAVLLSQQPSTIFPVFLKQNSTDRQYFFKGYFTFNNISNEPSVIADAEARSGRENELSYVITLKPV